MNVKRYFDEFYEKNFEVLKNEEVVEKVLESKSVGKVLDLGCGSCDVSLDLAEKGFDVVGVDFSDVVLKKVESYAKERGIGIDLKNIDLNYFKMEDFLESGCVNSKIPTKFQQAENPFLLAQSSQQDSRIDKTSDLEDIEEDDRGFSNFGIATLFSKAENPSVYIQSSHEDNKIRKSEKIGNFDVILCLDVLRFLDSPEGFVKELKKGLKKGGVLICSVMVSDSSGKKYFEEGRLEDLFFEFLTETEVYFEYNDILMKNEKFERIVIHS